MDNSIIIAEESKLMKTQDIVSLIKIFSKSDFSATVIVHLILLNFCNDYKGMTLIIR